MSEERHLTRRGPDQRNWYVVAKPSGDAETAIVAGALQSAGIPFWVVRESASTAIVLSVGLLAEIDVLVPEEYYEDARSLLDWDGPPLDDGAQPLDDSRTVGSPTADDWKDEDDPGDDSTGHG